MDRVNESGEGCETWINNALLTRYSYLHDKALRKEDDKTKDKRDNKCSQSSYHATERRMQFNSMQVANINQWSIDSLACLFLRCSTFPRVQAQKRVQTNQHDYCIKTE